MWAVETSGLTKDYFLGFWRKRRRALEDLNLKVEQGGIFGLLGPNGAGKSTTLKLLLHLAFPTAGAARLLDCDAGDARVHRRIGYLPENPYFYDHLTASEFLHYMGSVHGLLRDERRRRVGALIERVGLAGSEDLPLRKFSKGMVQRVGIAQALINDPELVFFDEPMSGLDPLGRRDVRDILLQLRDDKKTVFFSTHILSDAEILCDRVAVLHHGMLQGSGDLREILHRDVSSTEIILHKPTDEALACLRDWSRSLVRTGDLVRAEIPEARPLDEILGTLLRLKAKIIAINPVQKSLEDYFLEQVGEKTLAADAATVRPSGSKQ